MRGGWNFETAALVGLRRRLNGWASALGETPREATDAAPKANEAVQRYFFHVDDRAGFRDLEGTLLSGHEAARIEAARLLGQLVNEKPGEVWGDGDFRITVTDEAGLILFALDVAAVIAPAAAIPPGRPSGTEGC